MKTIKNFGNVGISIFVFLLIIFLIAFLFKGGIGLGVGFIKNHQNLINSLNGIIIPIIFLLLIISVIPQIRIFTGMGIVYITYIWMFLFWLNCLVITYEIWGSVGIFIGIFMFGLGIFATAILASLFTGQGIGALILLLTLGIMYGVRILGAWITTKQENSTENIIEVENTEVESLEKQIRIVHKEDNI